MNNFYHRGSYGDIVYSLPSIKYFNKSNLILKNTSKPLVECFSELLKIKVDFSFPWIENIEAKNSSKILINRTLRYHDKENINWSILKSIENICGFIGTKTEYNVFKNLTKLNIKFLPTKDCLEIAENIKGCKLFIGNQSLCYAVAESLKVDRVLEVCYEKPNCMPMSKNGCTSEFLQNKLIQCGFI